MTVRTSCYVYLGGVQTLTPIEGSKPIYLHMLQVLPCSLYFLSSIAVMPVVTAHIHVDFFILESLPINIW